MAHLTGDELVKRSSRSWTDGPAAPSCRYLKPVPPACRSGRDDRASLATEEILYDELWLAQAALRSVLMKLAYQARIERMEDRSELHLE